MKLKERLKSLKSRLRYPLAFLKFKKCGHNVWLGRNGLFGRPGEITFGNNVFINAGFHISARNLTFGNNIMIGPNLVIECDNHLFDSVGITMFENRNNRKIDSVAFEDDVWVGANVIVLKGVVIGEGSVIGAHSVVSRNIPPYTVCVGIPCLPRRPRFTNEQLQQHLQLIGSRYVATSVEAAWRECGLQQD
ncbi:MAG: acyltransferase [Candidatus Delongbacteria bacterium]|nr:acyltransferase [Candidatus Delongbacteria bacterium]